MTTGVTIYDRVDVQALLQTAVAVPPDLKKAVYFIDSTEIPVDRRFAEVTKSDYADTFDSSGYPYTYSSLHFSQKRTPQSLQVARWVQAASSPYWYSSDYSQTLASWQAVTDGEFTCTDGTNSDNVTGIDFSSITALSQISTVITAALAAVVTPTVVGLDSAVASFDLFNRLTVTMPGTGASAVTLDVNGYTGSGTDLTTLMDLDNGVGVAGLDAETIADAIDALRPIDDTGTYYTAKFTTSSDSARATEILSMAAKVESLRKVCVVTADDSDIKSSSDTASIAVQLQTLGYKRTMGIYFEGLSTRPLIIPEAALLGAVIPADEGSVDFSYEDLTGIAGSGYPTTLTYAETSIIAGAPGAVGKGFCVIEQVAGNTYLYKNKTVGGVELNKQVGADWFTNEIAFDYFTYRMNEPQVGFTNETLSAIEGIIQRAADEAIDRGILVDTAERPFTINLPDADDFTQSERASQYMELSDAYTGYLNTSVLDIQIIGTWVI